MSYRADRKEFCKINQGITADYRGERSSTEMIVFQIAFYVPFKQCGLVIIFREHTQKNRLIRLSRHRAKEAVWADNLELHSDEKMKKR